MKTTRKCLQCEACCGIRCTYKKFPFSLDYGNLFMYEHNILVVCVLAKGRSFGSAFFFGNLVCDIPPNKWQSRLKKKHGMRTDRTDIVNTVSVLSVHASDTFWENNMVNGHARTDRTDTVNTMSVLSVHASGFFILDKTHHLSIVQ